MHARTHTHLPSERVDLESKFLQQDGPGGVGQNEDHVHVARPQADQVAGVRHICELGDLYKAFFRNLAVEEHGVIRRLAGEVNGPTLRRHSWTKPWGLRDGGGLLWIHTGWTELLSCR